MHPIINELMELAADIPHSQVAQLARKAAKEIEQQQQIIDALKMECATQERGRKPTEEKGNHRVCEVRKLQQEVQSLRDMTHTLKEDNASLFNKLMQTHYSPQCEVMRSAFIAGVLCGNPQAEGRETVIEAADDYVCEQLVAKLKWDFDDISVKNQICTTHLHSNRRRDGALTMSDSKVFMLMNNHPNPVTRSVYRDMWIKRIAELGSWN
jgi:hypothetical protein